MALTGAAVAYTWARSGLARSGATRSNYVKPWASVDLIVRDDTGAIVSRVDLTAYIRFGSLQVTQALNDEPDTCSFQIVPTAPKSAVPNVGQEIAVAWTTGQPIFQGFVLVLQFDRRARNESPWVSVQCQDSMWRFDARMVTYRFPTQSVTDSIAFLVRYFCNLDANVPGPLDFRVAAVQPGMPSVPGFDVVNERPSTVMRKLTAGVGGGFYIDGLDVHAWAGSLSEPGQVNPQPLTNTLSSLKAFRLTRDASQVRRGVIVEGRRTSTLIALPEFDTSTYSPIGIPLTDASFMDASLGVDYQHFVRLGTQAVVLQSPVSVHGVNPPQSRLIQAFTPGDTGLYCEAISPLPPAQGWIRIGNQYAAYVSIETVGGGSGYLLLNLALSIHAYGHLTVPMAIGQTVEWVDCAMEDYPLGLQWLHVSVTDGIIHAQPVDTPAVLFARSQVGLDGWPPIEGFVQDGRYSYTSAQARADADLAAFQNPLESVEWETEDLHAQPGRAQVINLTGSSVMDPLSITVTITRVEITFPLRTLPPRRRCSGGVLKATTFLDLVVTDQS